MAFKKIVNTKGFWKSVAVMGILFALVYHFISMLFEYGGFEFAAFYQDKIADGDWIKFVAGTIISAFVYGFIISYGQFRSKIKKQEKEQ